MCSRFQTAVLMFLVFSCCTPYRNIQRISRGELGIGLSVPDERIPEVPEPESVTDSIMGTLSDGPIIMNAIRDSETGEMVATDVIKASRVTARFRNVAEREGYVSVGFDVHVPGGLLVSRWRLKIVPKMSMQNDTVLLDPVYITGKGYRDMQMRGFQRYRAFVASIITDTADLVRVRQLEIFLERYFPQTYAMKNDSSLVSEPLAMNPFGVSQKEALLHYTRHWRARRNQWKMDNKDRMFRKYVKDPVVDEGTRLDTVLVSGSEFIYRYVHTFRTRPGLRKVLLILDGRLYEQGECVAQLPFPDDITFYISSLSTLADDSPKYKVLVLERNVYDNTKALIDFRQGSSVVDTLLGDNASELRRIRRCVDDVEARKEYVLDSLVVVASCSPEGKYQSNRRLAMSRSRSVGQYVSDFVPQEWKDRIRMTAVPENWDQFDLLVRNDSVIGTAAMNRILRTISDTDDPDKAEMLLAALPQYRYLREKVYPKLRTVRFDFYLHRKGMIKDTVHTTLPDTVYMEGVRALKELDYRRAVSILRPYDDYNAALAFMSAGYNHSALDVMGRLGYEDPKVCYLMALVLSRLGQDDEAMKYFELCLANAPYMVHRANLDPEMSMLVRRRNKNNAYE